MFSWLLLCLLPALVVGFPDGAPVDACVKARPNTPYHGQFEAQHKQSNPYQMIASSSHYTPGSKISVVIQGGDFRGFFLQARDLATNSWLGQFDPAPNTTIIPECSAVTHGDNRDKSKATLIWTAPADARPGQVFFTLMLAQIVVNFNLKLTRHAPGFSGSIVKDYATFWTDIVALAPQ